MQADTPTCPQTSALAEGLPQAAIGQWYVLHTKSRQEKLLADTLKAKGIAHFLPMTRQVRFYGRHKLKVEVPLFASYLFLRGEVDDVYAAHRTGRVAQIISVTNQHRLDWELQNIQLALVRGADLNSHARLLAGTPVAVRSGPFRGLQGLVETDQHAGRLVLQVDMLGRAVSLEIDSSLLDRLD